MARSRPSLALLGLLLLSAAALASPRVDRDPRTRRPWRLSRELVAPVTRDTAEALARGAVRDGAALLALDPSALALAGVDWSEAPGRATVRFQQVHRGLPVVGGALRVVLEGRRLTVVSHVVAGLRVDPRPRLARAAAVERALTTSAHGPVAPEDVRLVVLPGLRERGLPEHLAWQVTLPTQHVPEEQARDDARSPPRRPGVPVPVQWSVFVDARDGTVLGREDRLQADGTPARDAALLRDDAVRELEAALGRDAAAGLLQRALAHEPRDRTELLAALLAQEDAPRETLCRVFSDLHATAAPDCAGHTALPVAAVRSPAPLQRLDGALGPLELVGTAQGSRTGALERFTVEYAPGTSPGAWTTAGVTLAALGTVPVEDGRLAVVDLDALADGDYVVRLTVTDTAGRTSRALTRVLLDRTSKPGWPYATRGAFPQGAVAVELDPATEGLELVARERWGTVHAWHADGTPVRGWPRAVFHWPPSAPAVADLDADGRPEVVVASARGVSVFRHDGSAAPGWPRGCTGEPGEAGPVVEDLEGDGPREVLVATREGRVCAWHADGTPVRGWPVQLGAGLSLPLAAADVDGDGPAEVAAVTDAGDVFLLGPDGTPRAGWPRSSGPVAVAAPVLGNTDGDADLEVAVLGRTQAFLFNGDGTDATGWPQPLPTDEDGAHAALADLDADGIPELLAVRAGALQAWRVSGTPLDTSPREEGPATATLTPRAPVAGDVDGDGDAEVLALTASWAGRDTPALVALGRDGRVAQGWPRAAASQGLPSTPALADVDGDGRVELLQGGDGWLGVWALPHARGDAYAQWPLERADPARTGRREPPPPDLSIRRVSHSPSTPAAGATVTLTVVIENQGPGPSHPGTEVTLRTPKATAASARQSWALAPLWPGQRHTERRRVTVRAAGDYLSRVTVDPPTRVGELDRSDNRKAHAFLVGAPATAR